MEIRPEQPGDAAAIRAVHVAGFPTPAEADLVDALRAAGRLTISLVAEDNGRVVGHVAFSPVTAANGAEGLGLAPIAVLTEHQRRGLGAKLVRAGLDTCRERNAPFAVVLGDTWYAAFDFQPAPQFGLTDEYGGGDAFQVLELRPGGLPRGAGLVRYATEFAMFG